MKRHFPAFLIFKRVRIIAHVATYCLWSLTCTTSPRLEIFIANDMSSLISHRRLPHPQTTISSITMHPAFIVPALPLSRPIHSLSSHLSHQPPTPRPYRPRAQITPPSTSSTPPEPTSPCVSTAAASAPTLSAALTEAASRALSAFPSPNPPTLAIVFVSARYSIPSVGVTGRDGLSSVVPKLRSLIPTLSTVLGCTAAGVIGTGPTGSVVELQHVPAVSVTLAALPEVNARPFHVMVDDLPSADASQEEWRKVLGMKDGEEGEIVILSDPSFVEGGELERFLEGVRFACAGSAVVGGVASAAVGDGEGCLICTLKRDVLGGAKGGLRDNGVVGVVLTGDVCVEGLVSGSCRQIGPVFEVRKVGRGGVEEMEVVGRRASLLSAVGCLKSVISYATPLEKRLIQTELHVGVQVEGLGETEGDGWLIRGVLGVDYSGGEIRVAQNVRVGQRIAFFVKERMAAEEQLKETMQRYKRAELAKSLVGYSNAPFFALVAVDGGRGKAIFGTPGEEVRELGEVARGMPVAGFFGGGQIGPLRGAKGGGVLQNAANVVALVRRRGGLDDEAEGTEEAQMVRADDESEGEATQGEI